MRRLINSPSQANQDSFVMNMLGFKHGGFYVEIGAAFPYQISNTFVLEKEYGWSGMSVEWSPELCYDFNEQRGNPCYQIDATTADYSSLFAELKAPKQIDYLQLDIDPASNTLLALKQMPLYEYRFSVVTFEHDLYTSAGNLDIKDEAYDILVNNGYKRVVSNVSLGVNPFEDWYVDAQAIPESVWGPVSAENIDCNSLFE
jgi:hypothetical protein